jgi:uncharacterized protein YfaS (alpha-2-macroglobulin family)
VFNVDSRQRIVSRRVLTPKATLTVAAAGRMPAPGPEKDFRVLAFWLGSVTTDQNGQAHVNVTLPNR